MLNLLDYTTLVSCSQPARYESAPGDCQLNSNTYDFTVSHRDLPIQVVLVYAYLTSKA